MDMYFTIITNREVAEQIKKQCEWDKKFNSRSFELGKISHDAGFSEVQILSKGDYQIKAEDIFWLGYYSASRK